MNITNEKLASIIIRFLKEKQNLTYYSISEKTGADQKSIKDWELQERGNIRSSSFNNLVSKLSDFLISDYERFSNYVITELDNEGISKEYTKEIFYRNKDIPIIMENLKKLNIEKQKTLQEIIGTSNIITILKSLFSQYRDYFQISEKNIGEADTEFVYAPIIYSPNQPDNSGKSVQSLNYLILKFPNAYHVGIILSNYKVDFSDLKDYNYYAYMIEKLKTHNNLKMLLFIADFDKNSIPFFVQSKLMEKYNLFFEFVKKKDLQETSIQGLKLQDNDSTNYQKLLDKYRYAQLVFERFMSYLSVISNEIIFQPYLEKLHKELDLEDSNNAEITLNKILVSYQKRSNLMNFTNYAEQILLKEICRYSYLSRHTIYYERNLIATEVESILEKQNIQKVPLVVEVCAPNSLTTLKIIDKCDKLLLFTASYNAYSLMTKLQSKTNNRFLPTNVSILLSHLNPEYMMHQYPDELNGKVDLLVIGYGAGSQINDLIRFIRYAYNWLSDTGVLFISVYNKDAIVLNKHHIHDQRFESSPLYISDYWTYRINDQAPLLKNIKAYSPDSFRSTYLSLFETDSKEEKDKKGDEIQLSTYPYMSALINPGDYSRAILDEIREADKSFAPNGTHGQMIDVIAHKNKTIPKSSSKIINYLNKLKIPHDCYTHTLAPDSKSLMRSLQTNNVSFINATLLKTVVLQEKSLKQSNDIQWLYAILPYNQKVAYDHQKYELVPESLVIKVFNQGTISPLTVITEIAENQEMTKSIFLLNNDRINTKYVIMAAGSNTESVRIKTKAFRKIVTNLRINLQNIIE